MIVDKIEDTLDGKYLSLFGEVNTTDCYRLKNIGFVPDIIYDLGCNVGTFTRFCRELWPDAGIVAVEPDKENYHHFIQFTDLENIDVYNKAIGIGQVYHGLTASNGSGETYLSSGLGYPSNLMEKGCAENNMGIEKSDVETIMPDELINKYWKPGRKSIVKIDIEGAENTIWTHKPSMDALRKMDYLCMEVHFYALIGGEVHDEVRRKTMEALRSFEETHDCELDNVHFWAIKKPMKLKNKKRLLDDCYISYLNLDIRPERKVHIESELNRIGINAERTRGKLPVEYDLTDVNFYVMLGRTPGAIGCWMGMREMMVEAIKRNQHCFIMEDDVVLATDFKERIAYMEKFFETHDWDIFFAGALFHCSPPHWHNGRGFMLDGSNLGKDAERTDDVRVIRTFGCFSTHCWIIKRESVEKVMKMLDSVMYRSIGIDHACIILQPQLNCYTFVGGSAKQIDNLSNIGTGMTMYSHFAKLNGTIENSAYWFTDLIQDFQPETFDWVEIK